MTVEQQNFLLQRAKEGFEIIPTKRADYTSSDDVLKLFKKVAVQVGITPEKAIRYEIEKKKERILSLVKKDEVNHESVGDNMVDIMNYYFLLSCLELQDFIDEVEQGQMPF